MPRRTVLAFLAILASFFSFPRITAAQLQSRPADEWAKTLDAEKRVSTLNIQAIIADLHLKPGQKVADIGAGTGLFEVPFAEAVSPGGEVYAVDIDAGFFPMIKKRAEEGHVTNVETILGKYTDPNLPTKVDLVFFHDVLHHIQDRAGYLKSVAGYLRPKGRVVVIDYPEGEGPHKGHPDLIVTRQQLAEWTKAAGLKQVQDIKLFPDKYFLVFSK